MTVPPLLPGDTIGVMAPSSYVERDDIEKSAALLEARGYRVAIHPQTYARHRQSAGTHAEKREALHALYADPAIRAIWAAGGGNRALYLLNDLDYSLIAANPKPLIGFSDVTALLNAINARTGQVGLHAQVFKNLHRWGELTIALDLLGGQKYRLDLQNAQIIQEGNARGRLVGGNLSLFHYLCGSRDCPPLEGAILFLEDCSDEVSRFDRMFCHINRLGGFDSLAALILGGFTDLRDGARPFGFSLHEIVMENLGNKGIPVIFDAPFGHGQSLLPMPVGSVASLSTQEKMLHYSITE
jgi:muramoyltetrapeptide carboxypeptidase